MGSVYTSNGYREIVSPDAKVGDMSELPIIDLEKSYSDKLEDRMEVAAAVRNACTRVGFFYIKNTTMPKSVRKAAFDAVSYFFITACSKHW